MLFTLLKAGAHLKSDKSFLGFQELTILGSAISRIGVKPGPEHLEASRTLPESATDRTGVKSILGFYEHYRKHFSNFSSLVAPLTELTRDKVTFKWEPRHTAIVRQLKRMMLSAPILVPFQPEIPLYLSTDVSQWGWGAVLFHVKEGKEHPIRFLSRKLTLTQRRWPPYVREAFGLVEALKAVRPYAAASYFPLECIVDHMPLRWIWSSRSTKVMNWVIDISELDFYVRWRAGGKHGAPDALSRIPCISPGLPSDEGIAAAVLYLRKVLTLPKTINRLWLSLQDQERNLSKEFRQRGRTILHGSPTQHNIALPWDFAIVTPPVEDSPTWAQALFDLGKPFAILVPGDLVYLIAMRGDQHDTNLQRKLDSSSKIAFMGDNLVWLCFLPDGPNLPHHVFTMDVEEPQAPIRLRTPPSRKKIQTEQVNDPVCAPWTKLDDGSHLVSLGSTPLTIIVKDRTVYISQDEKDSSEENQSSSRSLSSLKASELVTSH